MRGVPAAVVLVLAVASAAAQTTPVRDVDRPPTTGTGSVTGRVVTDETDPTPVRRAVVSLTGDGLRPSRGAITDDEGRFRIATLPAGRFTLTVSRASFITSAYGARRAGRAGTAIVVRDGEAVNDLVVRLWRGAAVAGVIRDETGTPVEGVAVTAVPARPAGGQTTLTLSNNGAVTNDLGEFRVFGLAPGTYVITATPQVSGPGPILAMMDAEVDAALDSLGRRTPGVAPGAVKPSPPSSPDRPFDYAPIYYPGTSSRAQATPITLAAGAEQAGLDFALQRVSTVVVDGTVSRADGQPAAGAAVQLVEVVPPGPFAPTSPRLLDAVAGPDGRFRITQVAPGPYQILARAVASPDRSVPAAPPRVIPGGIGGPPVWAAAELSVAGNDVTGLVLRSSPVERCPGASSSKARGRHQPSALCGCRSCLLPFLGCHQARRSARFSSCRRSPRETTVGLSCRALALARIACRSGRRASTAGGSGPRCGMDGTCSMATSTSIDPRILVTSSRRFPIAAPSCPGACRHPQAGPSPTCS